MNRLSLVVLIVMILFAVEDTLVVSLVHAQEAAALPADLRHRIAGDDWPGFLGPRGDSVSNETGILTDWQRRPPRIVWQVDLGTGYGICTIARGRCFQFDRLGNQARLRCFHSETGARQWTYTYPTLYQDYYGYNNGPRCSPVVDGNRVYIYGAEGQLHCINVTTGEKIWAIDIEGEYGVVQNFFGVGSTPVIFNDLLLVMVGGSPPDSPVDPGLLERLIGNGTGIVAFDKRSGKERYRCSNELASYAAIQLAKVNGRDWGFAFSRGGLLGFDPAVGKQRFFYPWRAKIRESVNASCPVVVGNEVLISETYGPGASLLAIQDDSFQVTWKDDARRRVKSLQAHWNTPVYHEGYVYASSGRHDSNAELRCVEWRSGRVTWSEPGLQRCSILLVDGHLFTQSENGDLLLVKATPVKYELVSKLELRDKERRNEFSGLSLPLLRPPAWAAPILSHGLLYVRGSDRLVCLELIPAVK